MPAADPSPLQPRALIAEGRSRLEQAGIEEAAFDSCFLFEWITGLNREQIIADQALTLHPEKAESYRAMIEKRAQRIPCSHLIGSREFMSLPIQVTPDVLTPRPETELLVEAAIAYCDQHESINALDVGTGSCCIPIAVIRHSQVPVTFTACDVSDAALAIAEMNCKSHKLTDRITLAKSDLCASIKGVFDLVCANLPYIPSAVIEGLMPEVRDHEPRLALDGGKDGLSLVQRLIAEAQPLLRADGLMLLEIADGQGQSVLAMLKQAGYEECRVTADYNGLERLVSAVKRTEV